VDCRLVAFGELEIEGRRFEHDVVIDGGRVRRRKKGPSKPRRNEYGHTPLTASERIPWSRTHIVGTGANGRLPIAPDLYEEAARREVEVVARPTAEACDLLEAADPGTVSAILHVTC
jgi:hypothetical protein